MLRMRTVGTGATVPRGLTSAAAEGVLCLVITGDVMPTAKLVLTAVGTGRTLMALTDGGVDCLFVQAKPIQYSLEASTHTPHKPARGCSRARFSKGD
jgi:hypothetical protein